MAAQKEKDKQIELVLAKILQELKKLHGSNQPGARNLPDLIDCTTSVSGVTGKPFMKHSKSKQAGSKHSRESIPG
jgi:hypothetical protein